MLTLFCTNCRTTWYIDPEEASYFGLDTSLDKQEISNCTVIGQECIPTEADVTCERSVAELGSISTATMRVEDLLPVFADMLSYLDTLSEYTWLIDECEQIIARADWDAEETFYVLNESLWDALDSFAPEGAYFGAHPGDGADYGYWMAEDD